MTQYFKPRMDMLPAAQQRLWPKLYLSVKLGLVLYGGTAIAIRLGHRASVDFDFFTDKPLDKAVLQSAFPFLQQSTVLQDEPNAYTVLIPSERMHDQHVRDIAAMVKAGVSLSKGLSAARQMYGRSFQPSESLKAMVYFEGGDLHTLTQNEKEALIAAASAVRDLPTVEIVSHELATRPQQRADRYR